MQLKNVNNTPTNVDIRKSFLLLLASFDNNILVHAWSLLSIVVWFHYPRNAPAKSFATKIRNEYTWCCSVLIYNVQYKKSKNVSWLILFYLFINERNRSN